jgi:outer membrane protein with beta-barrel domain
VSDSTTVMALAFLFLTPCVASAADKGFYAGASVSDVSTSYDWRPERLGLAGPAAGPSGAMVGPAQEKGTAYKVFGGIRPVKPFAVELSYVDLAAAESSLSYSPLILFIIAPHDRISLEARAISVSAVGLLSVGRVELFAKVGAAHWESDLAAWAPPPNPVIRMKDEGTDATYGAGLQLPLRRFALRLEYERLELGVDSADSLSLGFTSSFK